MKYTLMFGATVMLAVALVGCAAIMHGTSQEIGIGSSPSGASVSVDGQNYGKTPVTASLRRGDNHTVTIKLDGFHPYEAVLTRQVSGWVWGNLVFGGLVGLVIDFASGGVYNLTPTQVQATMVKSGNAYFKLQEEGLYVFVTLQPDPAWQKIGQMTKTE